MAKCRRLISKPSPSQIQVFDNVLLCRVGGEPILPWCRGCVTSTSALVFPALLFCTSYAMWFNHKVWTQRFPAWQVCVCLSPTHWVSQGDVVYAHLQTGDPSKLSTNCPLVGALCESRIMVNADFVPLSSPKNQQWKLRWQKVMIVSCFRQRDIIDIVLGMCYKVCEGAEGG